MTRRPPPPTAPPTDRGPRESAATVYDRTGADPRDNAQTLIREPQAPVLPPAPQRPAPAAQITVISMKTPGELGVQGPDLPSPALPPQPAVRIRAISEVSRQTPPRGLGRLAPPHDPGRARTRRRLDLVRWTLAVLVVASIVMLAVWLIARTAS